MVRLPLAHVSWAIADNADRPACDAFFMDVFGAETAFEMLETPETAHYRLDREERLMLIGDTMLLPIAPAGRGVEPDSPLGNMLRRSAGEGRWLGVSLRVADLPAADAWFRARDFQLHYDPGMETNYFLVSRRQALGVRLEIMTGELPGDQRVKPGGMGPLRERALAHPLGVEGLLAMGVSVPDLATAREFFAGRLEWPELGADYDALEDADRAAFHMGDTVVEALAPRSADSRLGRHLVEVQGICSLTFKLRNGAAAAEWLRGKGLRLIGDDPARPGARFAVDPAQAHGRLIWLTDRLPEGYPPIGSRMDVPAVFPAAER